MSIKRRVFLLDPFERLHEFLSKSILFIYKQNGFDVHYIHFMEENVDFSNIMIEKDDIWIYIVHPIYLTKNECIKKWRDYVNTKPVKRILYITEPLSMMIDRNLYQKLFIDYRIAEIWTYTMNNVRIFQPRYGQKYRRVAPFCNPEIEWIEPKIEEYEGREDHKIVMIGNMTKQRKEILDEFGDRIEHRTDLWEREDWINVLRKNVFYVNLHRIPKCKCLETLRVNIILANGGIIISEKVNEEEMREYEGMNIYFEERNKMKEKWEEIREDYKRDKIIYFQKWIYFLKMKRMEKEMENVIEL